MIRFTGVLGEIVGCTEAIGIGKFHRWSVVVVVFADTRFTVPPALVVQLACFGIRNAVVVANPPDLILMVTMVTTSDNDDGGGHYDDGGQYLDSRFTIDIFSG